MGSSWRAKCWLIYKPSPGNAALTVMPVLPVTAWASCSPGTVRGWEGASGISLRLRAHAEQPAIPQRLSSGAMGALSQGPPYRADSSPGSRVHWPTPWPPFSAMCKWGSGLQGSEAAVAPPEPPHPVGTQWRR